MTKKVVAVLALSLVSTGAFASQAHNLVSGGGDAGTILGADGMSGSFYTNDEYNIFWNPAFINGHKGGQKSSWATIENGANSGKGGTSGGFVTDMGTLNVGAFFNRPVAQGSQALDLIVGGEQGVKWGVGLTQSMSASTTNKASTTTLKAGVQVADFEPFVSYDVKNTADGTNNAKKMVIGTRYHFGEWAPYAAYRTDTAAGAGAQAVKTYGLGVGRGHELGKDVQMNYAFGYWKVENVGYSVPVNLLLSADAASWLTVRVGFNHVLRGSAASTGTLIGGTFHAGKADIDFTVGNTAAAAGADGNAFGTDAVVANAGLTYRW